MDVPLVRCAGPAPQLRGWERWHMVTVGGSLMAFAALMAQLTTSPSPAQAHARPVLQTPTTVTQPFSAVNVPQRTGLQMAALPEEAAPDVAPLGDGLPSEMAATETADWVPLEALAGLFAGVVAARLRGRPAAPTVMLATGGEDVKDEEAGRLETRLLATASPQVAVEAESVASGLASKAIFLLPLLFTGFILQAYFYGTPVAPLLPRTVWLWLHCVGGMLFGGLVFSSTLYEALVIIQGDPQVRKWWFERVPMVDGRAMLPFLGLTVISGVCLAQWTYRSLANAPPFVSLTLETLVIFGVMWASLDHSSQVPAKQRCLEDYDAFMRGEYEKPAELPDVLKTRLAVNAASCVFIPLLYWIMVTKPNFDLKFLFH